MKRALVIGLLVFQVLGCGDDGKAPFVPMTRKDGGPRDPVDAGPKADGGAPASNGPVLKFTAPTPASDPADDTVITASMVSVRCSATKRPGRTAVDPSSVAITLEKPNSSTMRISSTVDKLADDEYEAKFDLSGLPNGPLRFHCDAKDVASTPLSNSITLETLLDLGPKIEIIEPKDMSIHALNSPVLIQFQVSPQPLAEEDGEAEIKEVKLQVAGMDFEVTETDDKPGFYQTSVDFDDTKLFMVPPTSAEVRVTAKNGRTPEAATRSVKYDIRIDGVGPSIKVESPPYGAIVHGEVQLRVTVDDSSGVKPGTLRATIALDDNSLVIEEWDATGTTYQQTFDTRKFGTKLTQLTINLSATDVVDNEGRIPQDHLLRLDNLPPLISLNPPPVREYYEGEMHKIYCSDAFDPVGRLATNDLDVKPTSSVYRVLVEDQTNTSVGSLGDYFAGVAQDKVVLYAQPDPSVPLLKDTNDDGICDAIAGLELPDGKRPTALHLKAVAPRGSAWFPKMLDVAISGCQSMNEGGSDSEPGTICFPGTEMFRAIPSRISGEPAAVFAMNPTNSDTGACEGDSWEVLPIVGEGWACLAAQAEDKIGNIGISEPLRVCFNNPDMGGTPDCNTAIAPSCLDHCTISPTQRFPTGMILQRR